MISVTFPDGASRPYEPGVSGADIAKGISPSLAKRTVAMVVDGELRDLADPIERDAKVEFVSREDPRPDLEERALPRPVLPDDRVKLPAPHDELGVMHRLKIAKPPRDPSKMQKRLPAACIRGGHGSPSARLAMDRTLHKRFLDYRERHVYFGFRKPLLSREDYIRLDAEALELGAKGEERDDEEEERYAALLFVLLRD